MLLSGSDSAGEMDMAVELDTPDGDRLRVGAIDEAVPLTSSDSCTIRIVGSSGSGVSGTIDGFGGGAL